MTKLKKIIISIIIIPIVLWLSMFTTDYVRCNQLKTPVFAQCEATADDGGSGTYKGVFYTVEVRKSTDPDFGLKTDYIEMRLFDFMVFAVCID